MKQLSKRERAQIAVTLSYAVILIQQVHEEDRTDMKETQRFP